VVVRVLLEMLSKKERLSLLKYVITYAFHVSSIIFNQMWYNSLNEGFYMIRVGVSVIVNYCLSTYISVAFRLNQYHNDAFMKSQTITVEVRCHLPLQHL